MTKTEFPDVVTVDTRSGGTVSIYPLGSVIVIRHRGPTGVLRDSFRMNHNAARRFAQDARDRVLTFGPQFYDTDAQEGGVLAVRGNAGMAEIKRSPSKGSSMIYDRIIFTDDQFLRFVEEVEQAAAAARLLETV
jgi:hypothetical protein